MKKKKLKKRLDKLETALFFQEQRIKELEAKVIPEKYVTFKRFEPLPHITSTPFTAVKITKIDEED